MIDASQIKKGQILEGKITNITDFGVFVDLGGVSGLLHKSKIYDSQGVALYSVGKNVKVVVLSIENEKISLGQSIEYNNDLFYLNTENLLQYLGFSTSIFIGQAKRAEHFVYFKNLHIIDSDSKQVKLLNPYTQNQIDARCGVQSICNCAIEDVEKVCKENIVCKEQVALLDSILDDRWYELKIYVGRPDFRIKNNDPFRFSVLRINKEIISDNPENIRKEENNSIKTMDNTRQEPDSVKKAKSKVFHKMYVANVRNRLRQLNEPTENDCKRWIWELIQNAKDSISQDEKKRTVDIKIVVKNDEVVFKHNGSPFTADAQQALLYKYSEGKENSESTGRFGTGFLTTHTLSKIVSINAPLYNDESCQTVGGFSTTMFRDGLDESDLLEGLTKMEDSTRYFDNSGGWTTYTYHLKTPQNKNALELGLKNFISNIAQVMLFCKELKTVELDNNGIVTKIIRKQPESLQDDIFISEFEIQSENNHTRKFIHKYLEKHSEELTIRFKTDRNLRLITAIEIDKENNLVENENAPSHFCVLPLVGSEKHIMPIYLNSPDFEPDSERESLILIGEDLLADKGVISEGGINRLILKESIELYDSLVSYLSENGYHKLFLLAKGLKRVPDFEKNFNRDWFENEIILPYREILKKYAIVETEIGNQKLFNDDSTPNIIIPKGSKEVRQQIYSLSTEIFSNRLPLEKFASDWAHLAWEKCGLFEKEDLCKYVSDKRNASHLPSYDWLNNFLQFIKETDETLLKKYALVPNSNGDFVSLETSDFAEGVGLTDFILNTLLSLGLDLKPKLLNSNITAISLPIKVDAKAIAEKIDEQADTIIKDRNNSDSQIITKLLPLLNIIPDVAQYEADFVEKQVRIHYFAQQLFSNQEIVEVVNSDIPAKAWNSLHKWFIIKLIKATAEYKSIESLPTNIENKIQWLNNFITFVVKEDKVSKLDEENYEIIPNQNGVFCLKKNLYKDDNIPEELKNDTAEKFGIILCESLLHKEINTISITQEKDINTVIQRIKYIFENDIIKQYSEKKDKLDFAIYLLHFLPEQSSQILYNSQKSLLDIVCKYYYDRSKPYEQPITITCNTEDFWNKANTQIVSDLQRHIEENISINGLKEFLSKTENQDEKEKFVNDTDNGYTIIFLNNFYDYLKQSNNTISHKIIPNQNGDFCLLDNNFFKDDNIPEELKEVLSLVNSDKDFRKILAECSLSIQPTPIKTIKDIADAIDDAIKAKYKSRDNWEDDNNFKKAVEILTEYFRKNKNPNDIFGYSWNQRDSIELNVLFDENYRKIIKEVKEKGIENIGEILAKDAEIQKLTKEKEDLLAENQKLKEEKATLENKIQELENRMENASSDEEKEQLLQQINELQSNLQNTNNEISLVDDVLTISDGGYNGISKEQQIQENYEAKRLVRERLEPEGFEFPANYYNQYSTINGVMKDGEEYTLVVKSYKYDKVPFKIGANEWIHLMNDNAMFWAHFGGGKLGCIKLYQLLKRQSNLSLSFSTENLEAFRFSEYDMQDMIKGNRKGVDVLAKLLHYFKDVHFDFSNLNKDRYTTNAKTMEDYRFNEKSFEENIIDEEEPE